MPEPRTEDAATRFARESEAPGKSPPAKSARRKKTEALVDAGKLLDRLAEVTSEAERSRIRLEHEAAKRARLEAALDTERAMRDKAERALAQAKTAGAKLSAELKAEAAAREQAESDLAQVDEKVATLEQQVNLTWSQLKATEEEQGSQQRRWWRGDG